MRGNNARHCQSIFPTRNSDGIRPQNCSNAHTTNAKLALKLENAQAYIKTLKEKIVALKAKIKPTWQGQRPEKLTSNTTYFWFHGYQVHSNCYCHTVTNRMQHKEIVYHSKIILFPGCAQHTTHYQCTCGIDYCLRQ
jgi:hypothetical protein